MGLIQYFGVGLARVFRQDRFRVFLVDKDLFDSFHRRLDHSDDDFAILAGVGFARRWSGTWRSAASAARPA